MSMKSSVALSYFPIFVLVIAFIAVKAQDPMYLRQLKRALKDPSFRIDTARMTVVVNMKGTSMLKSPVDILLLSDHCHNCSYYQVSSLSGMHLSTTFLIDTRWGVNLTLSTNLSRTKRCSAHIWNHYGERGEYYLDFFVNAGKVSGGCKIGQLKTRTPPENSLMPILHAFLILLILSISYNVGEKIYAFIQHQRKSSSLYGPGYFVSPENQDETSVLKPINKERLRSIDSFRGICLAVMIFVNYNGGNYWFFSHSTWNGLMVADVVFPWFLFIMGVNIVLSIENLVRAANPASQILYKIMRRTLILFFVGLGVINRKSLTLIELFPWLVVILGVNIVPFINRFIRKATGANQFLYKIIRWILLFCVFCIISYTTNFNDLRIPGVLQRFAISYLVVTLLQWVFHKPVPDMASVMTSSVPWWHPICDIVLYWRQWVIILCLEVVWHCLTFLLPVPGCPTGYLGPGGLADQGKYPNCTGGAAMWIDRKVFGDAHMYGRPSVKQIYFPTSTNIQKIPFDPEGLLGSIHSCLAVFLGLQAGKIFLYYKDPGERMVHWFVWSLFLAVVSGVFTKFSLHDGWIPINKNLWSTSFVTTLSCMAFFIISVMYYVIDIKKWWTGVPFYFIGMNSILIYVGHEVFQHYFPFSWGAGSRSSHAEMLTMNMLGVMYWVIIAYACYKYNFFFKI